MGRRTPTPSLPGSSSARQGGFWGWFDNRPRRALTLLAAVAVMLMVGCGLGGGVLGAHLQWAQDQQELAQRSGLDRGPIRFGGGLDPSGHRHGGAIRMSFVGASVTRGWYVTSIRNAYPAVTARIVAGETRRAVDWKVTALPGAAVAQALTWSFPSDQDLVVVDIVTNDFLYGTPVATYELEYTDLLQKLRRGSPRAGFVCMGEWAPVGADDEAGETAYSFDQIVAATCNAFDGVYVPINQLFDVPGARGPLDHPSITGPARDLFHPNDYGDQLIAEAVVSGINGDPATEAVPSGAPILEPKPHALFIPGATPSPLQGHERSSPAPRSRPRSSP